MRTSVQRRVTLTIILAALLPLLAVWSLSLFLSYRTQRATAQEQQLAVTRLLAQDVSRFLFEAEHQLELFANAIAQDDSIESATPEQLSSIVGSGSLLVDVGLYTPEGTLVSQASQAGYELDMPESLVGSYLLRVVQQNQVYYGEPTQLKATSLPLSPDEVPRLRIAVPVQVAFDQRWVLVGDIAMVQLWGINSQHQTAVNDRVFILDSQGELISSASTQDLLDKPDFRSTPIYQTAGFIAEYQSPLGSEVLGTRTRIEPTYWIMVVEQPLSEIYADLLSMAIRLFIVVLGGLVIVGAIGWLVGRRITHPILKLARHVQQFADDPKSYQAISIKTGDELTILGDSFNSMASTINASQAALSEANQELHHQIGSRTSELEQALLEVQQQQQTQTQLLDTIRGMSMPIIPINKDTVVVPLVGDFSDARLVDVSSRILLEIEQRRARTVLLDLTGLLNADRAIAHVIVQVSEAARLLGAQVMLTGIRPEMAEMLINAGINIDTIGIAHSLEHVFKQTLARHN